MTDSTELARRVVASPHWRWLPGMRARTWAGDRAWFRIQDGTCHTGNMEADLSDAATLGCLLALVREAWGHHGAAAFERRGGGWFVSGVARGDVGASYFGLGRSEAEALVAALLAAPE